MNTKPASLLEKIFVVYSFLAISGAINLIFLGLPKDTPSPTATWSYIFAKYIVLFFGVYYITSHIKAVLSLVKHEWMLWFFCLYFYSSLLWNPAPNPPIKLLFTNLYYLLFAFYFLIRFDPKTRIELGFAFGVIIVLGGLIFALFFPHLGQHQNGSWRGLFEDRNYGAMYICMGIAFCIAQFSYVRCHRAFAAFTILAAVFFIFNSGSATGRMCCLIIISASAFLAYFYKIRNTPALIIATLFAIITVSVLALIFFGFKDTIFEVLGKDSTLTGRTDIWRGIFLAVEKAPWFGHGFGNSSVTVGGQVFQERLVDDNGVTIAQTSHNLWMGVLLQFGLVGLFVFIMLFIKIMWEAARSFYKLPYYSNILLLIIILIFSISLTIDMNPMVWICYVLIMSSVRANSKQSLI